MRYDAQEDVVFFSRRHWEDWSSSRSRRGSDALWPGQRKAFAVAHLRNDYRRRGLLGQHLSNPTDFIEQWRSSPVARPDRLPAYRDALRQAFGENALRRSALCPELLVFDHHLVFLAKTRRIGPGKSFGRLDESQRLFISLTALLLDIPTRIVAVVFEPFQGRYCPERHTWQLRFGIEDVSLPSPEELPQPRRSAFDVSIEDIPTRAWNDFLGLIPRIEAEAGAHFGRPVETGWSGFTGAFLYPEIVHTFLRCWKSLGLAGDFDGRRWKGRTAYMAAGSRKVRTARTGTLVKLITAHIQYDEEHEGWLGKVFETGHIREILLRFRDLRPAERGGSGDAAVRSRKERSHASIRCGKSNERSPSGVR